MSDKPYEVTLGLSADEYAALRADIAEHGMLVPVVHDQHGKILDGHHRARVAADLDVDYPIEVREVADTVEAWDVALAFNLARRHLTREQKRCLIAAEVRRRPDDSDRAVARRLGCDHKTVGSVRREVDGENAQPDDTAVSAVEASELTELTARVDEGVKVIDVAILEALSNAIAPALIAGCLTVALHDLARMCDDDDFLEPVRRYLIGPRIAFVLDRGELVAAEMGAGRGPCFKPLSEDEIASLRATISGGAS